MIISCWGEWGCNQEKSMWKKLAKFGHLPEVPCQVPASPHARSHDVVDLGRSWKVIQWTKKLMEGLKKNPHNLGTKSWVIYVILKVVFGKWKDRVLFWTSGLTFAQHVVDLADRSDSNGSAEASTQPSFNHQWRHRSSKFLSFRGLEISLKSVQNPWWLMMLMIKKRVFSTQLALGIIIIHYGKPYLTTSMREWQRVLNTTHFWFVYIQNRMWKTQQTLPPLQPKYAHFYKTWRVFVKKAIPFDLVIDDFLNKTWYFIQKFQLPCLIIRGFQLPSYLYNSLSWNIFWLYPHENYLEIFLGYWDGWVVSNFNPVGSWNQALFDALLGSAGGPWKIQGFRLVDLSGFSHDPLVN